VWQAPLAREERREEREEDVMRRTGPIDLEDALFVIDTRGGVYTGDDGGHAFIVEFTARRFDDAGGLGDDDEIVVVGLVPEAAADMIRGLVEVVAKLEPNALYDAGLIAAPYKIPPQADV
jgi:hypothetical protein